MVALVLADVYSRAIVGWQISRSPRSDLALDVIAIDADENLALLELKRERSPREMVAQAAAIDG